jgi:hypothetical protein
VKYFFSKQTPQAVVSSLPPSPPPFQVIANIEAILAEKKELLTECQVRMVNVLFVKGASNPRYYTFTAAEVGREGGICGLN